MSKTMITSIVVDDRERAVIPFFEEYVNVKVNVGRVTTGDYAILIKDKKKFKPAVIFERKTWKDFADSIKDGRMENSNNLREFETKYNSRIIFIIEGQPFPAMTRKFRGIPFKNILKSIDKMTVVDKFQIIQTKDPKMTAKRIVDIAIAYDQYYDNICKADIRKNKDYAKRFKTDKKNKKVKNKNKKEKKGGHALDSESESNAFVMPQELKQVRVKTHDRILQQMWTSLRGVSAVTAKVLSEKWTISEIVSGKVLASEIAELKYPSGVSIGIPRAKNILVVANEGNKNKNGGTVVTLSQAIEFTKAQEKLLKSIHGVSAVVAKQICKKYTLKQLCDNVTEDQLAQVKRSDQPTARDIGPAIAKKIMSLLETKNV